MRRFGWLIGGLVLTGFLAFAGGLGGGGLTNPGPPNTMTGHDGGPLSATTVTASDVISTSKVGSAGAGAYECTGSGDCFFEVKQNTDLIFTEATDSTELGRIRNSGQGFRTDVYVATSGSAAQYGCNSSAMPCTIVGDLSAANATSSVAAITVRPSATLAANDLVLNVESAALTNLFTVDLEGDAVATGTLKSTCLNVNGATSCSATYPVSVDSTGYIRFNEAGGLFNTLGATSTGTMLWQSGFSSNLVINGETSDTTRAFQIFNATTAGTLVFKVTGAGTVTIPGTLDVTGALANATGAGTVGTGGGGGGVTANSTGYIGARVHKVTITHASFDDADGEEDVVVWSVPAKFKVGRVIADVVVPLTGGVSDLDAVCGTDAELDNYLSPAFDADTATGTYGDAEAELGLSLVGGLNHIPSWSGTTAISCRFTCAGANCVDLSAGSVTFYIEGTFYP